MRPTLLFGILAVHFARAKLRRLPAGAQMVSATDDCLRFQGHDAPTAPRVHLHTFYTRGPPYDQGRNMSRHAAAFRERLAPHFASFREWTHSDVAALRADVVAFGSAITTANPGYNAIGYGAFKPWVLLEALMAAAPGEIVVLHDVDVIRYSAYTRAASELPSICRWVMATLGADVWMPMENPLVFSVGVLTKPMVVREIGAGYFPSREIYEAAAEAGAAAWRTSPSPASAALKHVGPRELALAASRRKSEAEFAHVQAQASPAQQRRMAALFAFPSEQAHITVVRNTPAAAALLHEWLAICRPEYLAPTPNPASGNPTFDHHTCEQSTFSLLAAMKVLDGSLPLDYPRYAFGFFSRKLSCAIALRLNSTLAFMDAAAASWDERSCAHCEEHVEMNTTRSNL